MTRTLAMLTVACLLFAQACSGDDNAEPTSPGEPAAATNDATESTEPPTTLDTTAPVDDATPDTTEPAETTDATMPAAAFPVTIEHALGSAEISAAPERVVSASGTMTGHLLAIGVPVVAAQVLPPQSPLSDDQGFLKQWGAVATEQGVEPIAGPEINIEAIAAAEPDVIIGNSFGGDAVTEDVYQLLEQIAPTIVVDHSGMQWQELAMILGEATGHADEAQAAVDQFDARVADVAASIDTSHPVVAGVITPEGVNVFTAESSHGKLLTSLGLTLVSPEGGTLEGEQGAQTRSDVVSVSPELVPDEFGDATVLFVFAEQDAVDEALGLYPTLAATPAAQEGRLIPLGVESFRIDAYSANLLLDRLAAALGS